jgi:ferredoxin
LCGGHAQCVSVCSTGAIQLFDKGRAKDDWRRTKDEGRLIRRRKYLRMSPCILNTGDEWILF